MKKYWPLIVIVAFGALLRFYHNIDISLWHDEAFSALMVRYPWSEMLFRLGLDVHPPMYYIFLRLWRDMFGDSLLSLRSMSIFFGAASIWAAYAFVREAFKNRQAAIWAAILIAVNPFQLKYVTEARMYTMGAFFALLCGYFLVKALNTQRELAAGSRTNMPNLPGNMELRRKMAWLWVGFGISAAIIIYTHYYLFFTAAALGVYGLIYLIIHYRKNFRQYVPFIVAWAAVAVAFLPWLKVFLWQLKSVGGSYWIPKMTVWSIPATLWDMLLGLSRDVSKSSTQLWLVVIVLFSLFMLYRFLRKTDSPHKWLAILAVLAPFGGAILFEVMARLQGSSSSVYMDRYFLFGSVYYSVVLAVWLAEIRWKRAAVGLFVAYVLLNLFTFWHYWSSLDVKTKPGMAAAARYMKSNVEPSHHIVLGTSFEFFNFKYYWTQAPSLADIVLSQDGNTRYDFVTGVRPLLYTGGRDKAAQMSSVEGNALLTDADLLPDFKKGINRGDTVWVVWTNGFGSSKPGVPSNWVQIEEKGYAEVRPYVGTWIIVTEYKVN